MVRPLKDIRVRDRIMFSMYLICHDCKISMLLCLIMHTYDLYMMETLMLWCVLFMMKLCANLSMIYVMSCVLNLCIKYMMCCVPKSLHTIKMCCVPKNLYGMI